MKPQPRRGGPALAFGLLGPLRLDVDGGEVPIDSPKQRALLEALLIEVGAVVPTDRLADALWGKDQPDDPVGTVHIHVSRLRRVLERAGVASARDLLVTRPGGYALVVDPDQVDARRFERLVDAARAASAPQDRAELTGAALRLWRAPALPEFDHPQATAEAARLEELRGAALELRADALLRLGRCEEVVAEIAAAIARHPLRERLRGQLMVALYRSARQAEALATYRDLRDEMVGELGVEPTAALRALERAILQQAESLPWPAPPVEGGRRAGASGRAGQAPAQRITALPPELTSFVGRDTDIRGVTHALRTSRLVVLTGVGGVGKSRLAGRVARELAEDYVDGVVLCDLATTEGSSGVADVVGNALGVLPSGRRNADGLIQLLRGQSLLLLLDNCEHVTDGASELVDRIGQGCPDVHVLATSRTPLDVAGQQIWPVAPLEIAQGTRGTAVELFYDRAMSANPAFDPAGADRGAVMELCRRLDGLPLAIELAAARARAMTPSDIAERLDSRFDLLTLTSSTTPPRHRSLQAALDWSYESLPVGTQRLFDRLAVFAGGFRLDDAVRVCAGDGVPAAEVTGRLAELVDHALVVVDRPDRHARYRLLESLRAYGEAHLEARREPATVRRRYAEHCMSLAQQAAVGLRGPDEARWVHLVDRELANFRSAHRRACVSGQADVALGLPGLLRDYAYFGLRDEVYGWAERALGLPGASAHPARPTALLTVAVGRMQRGELDQALADCARVLAETTDEELVLRATQLSAEVALYQGRLNEVERRGEELLQRARATANPWFEALGHLYRVHAAAYGRRPVEAGSSLVAGWRAVAKAGTPSLRAAFTYLEGEIRLDAEPEVAIAAFHQAIATTRVVGNRFLAGVARVAVASLEARHGDPEQALLAFREIVDHWRRCGDWVHLWTTLHNLVGLLERVGADEAAAVLHGAVATASTGAAPFGADAERLEVTSAVLRRSLGDEAFAAADTMGRCMSDEEAVAFAREQIGRLLLEPSERAAGRATATDGPRAPGGSGPRRPCGTG